LLNTTNGGVRLLSLSSQVEPTTEAKCLAINPRRTEYLAVGANDPYARVFDRRMLPDEGNFIELIFLPLNQGFKPKLIKVWVRVLVMAGFCLIVT